MRLLFVTPELTPYSSVSPAADTCWALPKALKGRGHDVVILSPLYGFIDPSASNLARRLRKVEVDLDGEKTSFAVYDARTAAGVDLLFLGHEELFGACKSVPLDDESDANARRFGAFCRAALEVVRTDDPGFDLVHCHDWPTALIPALIGSQELDIGSVLTVHDVQRQGRFRAEVLRSVGFAEGHGSFLEGGIAEADRVTTVSPTFAGTLTKQAAGLEKAFADRGKELSGIAGGIDIAVWNPATDAHLETRYDPMDLTGKRRCKAAFQAKLELPITNEVPLVVVVGALHESSGLDVLARIVGRLMRNDLQLAVVAEPTPSDESLVAVLLEHQKRWPDRLHIVTGADTTLVHQALSAADFVLVPPKQPPGGSLSLRAHRYGALPIGRRAGAIADTVVDCEPQLESGNGFLFDEATDDDVLSALQRAIAAYTQRAGFRRARARGMRADHSWERSAYLYERLYEGI